MANTEDDIKLPGAEEQEDVPGLPEASTILELMDECEREGEEYRGRYLPQALYNERMCEGDQNIDLDSNWEIVAEARPDYVPKANRNLLRNLRLTWSSRILEDRPFGRAWPAEPGADEIKADLANKNLEYFRQRIDFDDLCFRAAQLVQPHSAVGFKTVWDPLIGPASPGFEDEEGNSVGFGEPQGDVTVQLVSIFDYVTDGAEDIEDSKWVMFYKQVNPHDAASLLRSAGIPAEKLDVKEWEDTWGVRHRSVLVTELWWKPDSRFPQGLYAVRVGGVALQVGPFPYRHGELPLAVWKAGPRRGSPLGSTHVDDAVYIQKVINDTVAALWQQSRQIGAVKLLAHPNVVEQWEHGNQMLQMPDMTLAQYVRYLEPPNRAQVLVETLEDNVQALFAVFGLNEFLSGAENVKAGTSARSIAYLNKLDSMKMAGASRSLGKAITRILRQYLKLTQEWVVGERLARVLGVNNTVETMLYTGADFNGMDVHLEAASSLDQYRATLADDANQQLQAGMVTPQNQAQAATGMKNSAFTRSQQDIIMAQLDAMMKGQPQQPSPDVDPMIAVDVLTKMLNQYQGSPVQAAVLQLLQGYQQKAANAQPGGMASDAAIADAGAKNEPSGP